MIYFQILFITFVFIANLYTALGRAPPYIDSKFETILSVGGNHSVSCYGDSPVTWKTPLEEEDFPEDKKDWTILEINDFHNKSGFYSILSIRNMSYPFVGYYHCKFKDDLEGSYESNIYLYVEDPYHLAVRDTGYLSIDAIENASTIVPCKPTHPGVTVSLTYLDGTEPDNIRYNKTTGFELVLTEIAQAGQFYCSFTYEEQESTIYGYLVFKSIDFLNHPYVKDLSNGHNIVGDDIFLECITDAEVRVSFTWLTPHGPIDKSRMTVSDQLRNKTNDPIYQKLTIKNATLEDNGIYSCKVSDYQGHAESNSVNVTVYEKNEHFLSLAEPNGIYTLQARSGDESMQWVIEVNAHPIPNMMWIDNKGNYIPEKNTDKYEVSFESDRAFLKIKKITIEDFGYYVLIANTTYEKKNLTLFLNVTDKPLVQLENYKNFYIFNSEEEINCSVAANPEPIIRWQFKPCQDNSCSFQDIKGNVTKQSLFSFLSKTRLKANHSGYIKCSAENSIGRDEVILGFHVTDVKNGFDIFDFNKLMQIKGNEVRVAEGEEISMTCGAYAKNYTNIEWFYNDTLLRNDEQYDLVKMNNNLSNKISLKIQEVKKEDTGVYSCRVQATKTYLYKNYTFYILDPQKPQMISMKPNIEISYPMRVTIKCQVSGIPKPFITWFKDGQIFEGKAGRILLRLDNSEIQFLETDISDEGVYLCEAQNKMGIVRGETKLIIKNKGTRMSPIVYAVAIILAVLCAVLVISVIYLFIKYKREKKILKNLGFENFEKGDVGNINPDLGIGDQAELLPYEIDKWEFPFENLKFGKPLGSGAFGIVRKAEAKHLVPGEESTTVAVKMVKKTAEPTYIRALASELKIMSHLGKHINVVNLLGACTKKVVKRELYVIVEYCKYGNLHNFLLKQRDNYINQVVPNTGNIDYSIGKDILERTYSDCSTRSNFVPSKCNMLDYRANNENCSDITAVSMSQAEEGAILSNNSIQPEWRSNYKGDYKGKVQPISTKDLVTWSFQIARGMDYLASRRVLHGDLAARNILLAENNVVKICDFGLAKSMYNNDNYKKKGNSPLPIKWMAIESIRDKVFSTQSDVWSFGIVLWELFSLARTPYPGMEADERLYYKLVEGYRMEPPIYSPKQIYSIMEECWECNPTNRPSFSSLVDRIGSLLEDSIRKHYIDLNDPYLVMNTKEKQTEQTDYLSMLNSPDFENLSSPLHYINEPRGDLDNGYLCMKSNIFSPRPNEEPVFNFSPNSKARLQTAEASQKELDPILHTQSESDCESPKCASPVINSISNPSYHLPPQIKFEEKQIKAQDNYVNMPQSKLGLIEDKNSKNGISGVHYVNYNTDDSVFV